MISGGSDDAGLLHPDVLLCSVEELPKDRLGVVADFSPKNAELEAGEEQ